MRGARPCGSTCASKRIGETDASSSIAARIIARARRVRCRSSSSTDPRAASSWDESSSTDATPPAAFQQGVNLGADRVQLGALMPAITRGVERVGDAATGGANGSRDLAGT